MDHSAAYQAGAFDGRRETRPNVRRGHPENRLIQLGVEPEQKVA